MLIKRTAFFGLERTWRLGSLSLTLQRNNDFRKEDPKKVLTSLKLVGFSGISLEETLEHSMGGSTMW